MGNLSFRSVKGPTGLKVAIMAVKKSRKRPDFVIYSYFTDSVFIAIKVKKRSNLGM